MNMKLKLVVLIVCLVAALPLALAQGRGGQGGQGQNVGSEQGKPGAGAAEMGRGSTDRQRDRIHVSQQQQDQIRSCDRSADAVRSQARQMGEYSKNGGFNPDKTRQDGKQLQERVTAMQQDHEDLPLRNEPATPASGRPGLLAQIERATILETLSRNKGDRRATSEELGISLRTLQYRLKEYGIGGRE
jgi:DNA-binding NtrC family response regulator